MMTTRTVYQDLETLLRKYSEILMFPKMCFRPNAAWKGHALRLCMQGISRNCDIPSSSIVLPREHCCRHRISSG